MKPKLTACCLSVVMIFGLLTFSASATNTLSTEITDTIPENVAEIIASHFVEDFSSIPDSNWTANTVVSNTVTLYNVDGAVSAYSFELTTNGMDTGYVVISAYPDVESVILEFSDEEEPLYNNFTFSQTDSLIYTGSLNYFKESSETNLLAVDGSVVSKSEVPTPLEESRDIANLPVQTRSVITDPFTWAEMYYGGQFSAIEWKNAFEAYCDFCTTYQFQTIGSTRYYGHCTPTSITNLIRIVGNYRNYAPVRQTSENYMFQRIANYGIDKQYYVNSPGEDGGTFRNRIQQYIKEAFAMYNINVSVSSSSISYSTVKNAIDAYKPIHVSVSENEVYGTHGMAGYAYTMLENQYDDRISFLKVADGWSNSGGRYLPIYTLSQSDNVIYSITVGTLG